MMKIPEAISLIEQSDTCTSWVICLGRQVFVFLSPKRCALGQVVQDRIIFYFTKSHDRGRVPFSSGGNDLRDLSKFMIITSIVPMTKPFGSKLIIISCGIIALLIFYSRYLNSETSSVKKGK